MNRIEEQNTLSPTRRLRMGKMQPIPLKDALGQCEEAAAGNRDLVVSVKGMTYEGGSIMQINREGDQFLMDEFSWNQLSKHLKSRLAYWDLFPDQSIDVISGSDISRQAQINYLLGNNKFEDKDMLIRGNDNTGLLRAYLGPRYARINNLDILHAISDIAPEQTFGLQTVGYCETRRGFYINLASPEDFDIGEPGSPDVYHGGVRIINSEVGFRKLVIMCFFWRMVCTNGLVIMKIKGRPFSRKHIGHLSHDDLINFLGDSIDDLMETEKQAYPTMKRAKNIMIPVDEENTMDEYIRRTLTDNNLPISVVELVQIAYQEEAIPSRYYVGQAITRAAQQVEDEDLRHDLEEFGGQYLIAA